MKNLKQKPGKTIRAAQYRSKFLTPTEFLARNGKTVYISKEFHQKLSQLVFMLGGGRLTLADYLHNLLQDHFDDYGAEMNKLYDKTDKPIFKKM
ncbi:DUF3408 domain-containing protein [Flavobacterium dauae]|uniref:DUF3408 domain-containing protein n=1 Tax=Flavobacterium dauae TaxID=1563479 RepID=UPI00101D3C46|nr:DUF3408 domain-containing protein [Flavobacterium dauae]WLD24327.1 DUF3408 domain-containing protein [Flavobacterium dauae]HZW78633.1 DUF3408 domain-containing protein [Flavobacteriaceae bacterium]